MKISVITTSYNYADFISETIESVLNQTFQDWELIIVDDGSKDNSISIISDFCKKDSRIKLFTHENNQNKGLTESIKLGLKKCSNEFIAFLESDDIWVENCLEKRVEILENNPELNFIYNNVEPFGDEEAVKEILEYKKKYFPTIENVNSPCDLLFCFYVVNLVPTLSSVTVRKNIIEKCDFDTPIKPWLDWWIYQQIAIDNRFYFIKELLTKWRRHKQSYIQQSKSEISRKTKYDFHKKSYGFILKSSRPIKDKILCKFLSDYYLAKFFRGTLRKILVTYTKLI